MTMLPTDKLEDLGPEGRKVVWTSASGLVMVREEVHPEGTRFCEHGRMWDVILGMDRVGASRSVYTYTDKGQALGVGRMLEAATNVGASEARRDISDDDTKAVPEQAPTRIYPDGGCSTRPELGPDGTNGPHSYQFLRQERRNIGFDRNPEWLVEDVYVCTRCLKYERVAVERRTPKTGGISADGGSEWVERLR